jgi:hypothetical protein
MDLEELNFVELYVALEEKIRFYQGKIDPRMKAIALTNLEQSLLWLEKAFSAGIKGNNEE